MSFSSRMGIAPKKMIQLNNLDTDLRNALWNATRIYVINELRERNYNNTQNSLDFYDYAKHLWNEFLKEKVENINGLFERCVKELGTIYDTLPWFKVYDFVEITITFLATKNRFASIRKNYVAECNRVLQRESSGYRIINEIVTPISNEIELNEIDDAINTTYDSVQIHLSSALAKLSNRENPDYRNSIKESISAVENLCRELTSENTLGKALNKFERSGISFNQQFKDALEKLYAYTNNKETGIRHALMESNQVPDFDEAKFMLVTCSAFVNYLLSKKSQVNNT